jgi:hypothetical protein
MAVLAMCVPLCIPLVPTLAPAGGKFLLSRGHAVHAPHTLPGGFKAAPVFQSKSAFGSPGGFPFVASDKLLHRPVVPFGFPHRFRHHVFVSRFPSTVFLSTPAALYGPPVETPSPVVDVSPVINVSPTVYVSPTVVLPASPVAVAAPPATPPLPRVVEHPTGRYELRGGGTATPYEWVWIPNPPPVPPPAAAAPTPADQSPAAPAARGETYRWTDGEGTTYLTNRLEGVPEAFRPRGRERASFVEPR